MLGPWSASSLQAPRRRPVLVAALLLISTFLMAGPAAAAVSVSRAEVSGSNLRIEGTAVASRDITVDGVAMGRSDSGGKFRIDRTAYTPPPDCTVDVNDGSATPRSATLTGCTVTSPPPPPPPPPSTQAPPSLLAPAAGASVTAPVTMSWSQVLNAGSLNGGYNWQVSTSPTFSSLAARDSTRPSVTQAAVGGLAGGTYYWQVQASSGDLWLGARSTCGASGSTYIN